MEGGRIVQSGAPEDIVLRPADDYVRDFIANVNPLSVLTAWNVMRDRRDLESAGESWVWLDRRKTTRFRLDADGTGGGGRARRQAGALGFLRRGGKAARRRPACVLGAAGHVAEES